MLHDDERPAPRFPVACERCGVTVLVKKNSLAHTVVQWTGPGDACDGMTDVETQPIAETCVFLRASIEAQVRSGNLVPADAGEPGTEGSR